MPDQLEMRIGNWFFYTGEGCYCTVTSLDNGITIERLNYKPFKCSVNELSSVLLNSKILSVCKFSLSFEEYMNKTNPGIIISMRREENNLFSMWVKNKKVAEVKFVHQLQNAYFSITGKELQPNLFGI